LIGSDIRLADVREAVTIKSSWLLTVFIYYFVSFIFTCRLEAHEQTETTNKKEKKDKQHTDVFFSNLSMVCLSFFFYIVFFSVSVHGL